MYFPPPKNSDQILFARGRAPLPDICHFSTRAKFLENKIFTEKFFALNLKKTPLFRVKSVEYANFLR